MRVMGIYMDGGKERGEDEGNREGRKLAQR